MKLTKYLMILLLTALIVNAQWREVDTGIPEGKFVQYIEPVNENVLWACIQSEIGYETCNLLIRSTDGGVSWELKTNTAAPATYNNSRVTAIDENTAWVAMFDNSGSTSGGIFKTTDGGDSWTQQTTAFSPNSGGFVNGVHFFDPDNGLCLGDPNGGYFEVYTTTNGGDNWVRVLQTDIPASPPSEFGTVLTLYHYNNNFWFSTLSYPYYPGKRRIFRSTDMGHTWSVSELSNNTNEHVNTFAFEDENNGLATNLSNVIAKTTDGGVTWNNITGPDWLSVAMLSAMPGKPGTYFGSSEFVCGDQILNTVVYTTDGGSTWARDYISENWPRVSMYSSSAGWVSEMNSTKILKWEVPDSKFLAACPSSLEFDGFLLGYSSSDQEITISNFGTDPLQIDGINTATNHFVLENLPIFPLALSPFESVQFSIYFDPQSAQTISDSIIFQSDAGNSMNINLSGAGMLFAPAKVDEIYFGGDSLVIYNSLFTQVISSGNLEMPKAAGLTIKKDDKHLYAVYGQNDFSEVYQICPETFKIFKMTRISIANITCAVFDNSGILYGASNSGDLFTIDMENDTYTLIGNNGLIISGIDFHPQTNELWCCVSSGTDKDAIYKLNPQTAESTIIGKTGDNKGALSLSFDSAGNLYILKGGGFAKNSIWSVDQSNGSGTEVIEFNRKDLTSISFSTSVVTEVEKEATEIIPTEFMLHQNYPNPFNPSTKIKFVIPAIEAGHATSLQTKLIVFDILGKEKATLVNETKAPGMYEIEFNASNLPSGIYFYSLSVGNFYETNKMMLLK